MLYANLCKFARICKSLRYSVRVCMNLRKFVRICTNLRKFARICAILVLYGLVGLGLVWLGLIWLDVLAKTPGLYLVPELRYPWSCCRSCHCPPPCCRPPPPHHHHEADALDVLDVLAKIPGLYLVPKLRYWVKYLVEKNVIDEQTDRQPAFYK